MLNRIIKFIYCIFPRWIFGFEFRRSTHKSLIDIQSIIFLIPQHESTGKNNSIVVTFACSKKMFDYCEVANLKQDWCMSKIKRNSYL